MKKLLTILFAVALGLNLSAQVPDYVPTDGLVAWYPFNGNANDESGNGNDGVIDGATPISDRYAIENAAYSFNGESSYILVESDFDFNERSVCLWARALNIEYSMIYDTDHNSLDYGLTQFGCGGLGDFGIGIGHPGGINTFHTDGDVDVWYMLAFTRDSDSTRYFFNGSNGHTVANGNISSNGGPSHTWIGARRGAGDRFFHGSIDDIGSWNRALTAEEILALYNAELPTPGCTDPTACNFDAEATSDDGSCIPSGCMETDACNYNALAECEGEACDYTCCPGPGCCLEGTVWAAELGGCIPLDTSCPHDLDFDGVVGVNDLMELLSAFGTDCPEPEGPATSEFTCGDPVSYHGYDYATVQIGEQCWFAENCRHLEAVSPPSLGFEDDSLAHAYVQGYGGASVDEAMTMENFALHGVLYNQLAAESWDICPTGWHVPIDSNIPQQGDFEELKLALPANAIGTALKASPTDVPPWDGNNSSGFKGISSGARSLYWDGELSWLDITAFYWSQSGWSRRLDSNDENLSLMGLGPAWGLSVRCIKDSE